MRDTRWIHTTITRVLEHFLRLYPVLKLDYLSPFSEKEKLENV